MVQPRKRVALFSEIFLNPGLADPYEAGSALRQPRRRLDSRLQVLSEVLYGCDSMRGGGVVESKNGDSGGAGAIGI